MTKQIKIKVRQCVKCKKVKSITGFSKHIAEIDGIRTVCRVCVSIYRKEYWKKNKEKEYENHTSYRKRMGNVLTERYAGKRKEYAEKTKDTKRHYDHDYNKKNWERKRPTMNFHNAKRRATLLNQTPPWADMEKIKLVYKKAFELGVLTGLKYAVDHVIPLQGKNVCGLHVWENLQVLEKSLNFSKNNKENYHE